MPETTSVALIGVVDHDKAAAVQRSTSVLAPAQRSPAAEPLGPTANAIGTISPCTVFKTANPGLSTRQALLGQQRHPDPEHFGQEQVLTSSFAWASGSLEIIPRPAAGTPIDSVLKQKSQAVAKKLKLKMILKKSAGRVQNSPHVPHFRLYSAR